ncbi:hypothetical protein DFH28DRAFT_1022888 [Melampsora americana]|nr:hypothetical protein DFH28DRAFT_1022888 [Melampsora americana]
MHTSNYLMIVVGLIASRVFAHPGNLDSVLVPAEAQELQRRAISPDVLLNNGKLAQGLNAKYATMTMESSCKEGDHACLQGGFAQCVAGKFVSLGCSPPTVCFELPLLLKPGSVPTCTTPADAAARIANTGVKGGVKGDGSETSAGSNTTSPIAESPSLNGTGMGMGDTSDEKTAAPDATSGSNTTSTANTTDSESSTNPSADPADEDASSSSSTNATLPVADVNNSTASATEVNSNTTSSVEGASNATSSNATDPNAADSDANVTPPAVGENSTEPKAAADTTTGQSSNSTSSSGDEDCVEE